MNTTLLEPESFGEQTLFIRYEAVNFFLLQNFFEDEITKLLYLELSVTHHSETRNILQKFVTDWTFSSN